MRVKAERRILTALCEGRREAYETVIDAHYASIYRLMLFMAGDANMAEDLTQEVFAAAWGAIHNFRGQASIKTWLHRIAYNMFFDVQRRRARDKALAAALGADRPAAFADPVSRLMADEHVACVYQGLDNLDVDERAALILHYAEGLSYREMAKVLDRPNGTVKWLTSLALEKLRKQLVGKVEP